MPRVYPNICRDEGCVYFHSGLVLIIRGYYLQTGLVGFYDVSFGEDKQLAVKYRFRNIMHEVIIADCDPLKIPRQCMLRSASM